MSHSNVSEIPLRNASFPPLKVGGPTGRHGPTGCLWSSVPQTCNSLQWSPQSAWQVLLAISFSSWHHRQIHNSDPFTSTSTRFLVKPRQSDGFDKPCQSKPSPSHNSKSTSTETTISTVDVSRVCVVRQSVLGVDSIDCSSKPGRIWRYGCTCLYIFEAYIEAYLKLMTLIQMHEFASAEGPLEERDMIAQTTFSCPRVVPCFGLQRLHWPYIGLTPSLWGPCISKPPQSEQLWTVNWFVDWKPSWISNLIHGFGHDQVTRHVDEIDETGPSKAHFKDSSLVFICLVCFRILAPTFFMW